MSKKKIFIIKKSLTILLSLEWRTYQDCLLGPQCDTPVLEALMRPERGSAREDAHQQPDHWLARSPVELLVLETHKYVHKYKW